MEILNDIVRACVTYFLSVSRAGIEYVNQYPYAAWAIFIGLVVLMVVCALVADCNKEGG